MTRTHHVKTTLLGCILLLCGGCKALPISSFGGCGSDNDCKGQRICIDRACRGPEAESIGTTASQEGLLCGGPQSDGTLRVGQCASSCPTDSGTVPMTFQNVKGSRGCGPGAVCCLHTSGNIAGASKGSAKDAQARWLDAKLKARVVVLDWGVRESEIKVNTEGDTHKLKIPIVYGSMKTTFTFDDNGLPGHLDRGTFWLDGEGGGTTEADFTCENASACKASFATCFGGADCQSTTLELSIIKPPAPAKTPRAKRVQSPKGF